MAAPFKTRGGAVSSVGAADAGKVPILNADGKLDNSFLPIQRIQGGSATAPNSGTHTTSATVYFPVAFTATPIVIPILRQAAITASGVPGMIVPIVITPTYFTVSINVNDDDSSGGWNINVAPNFDWVALQL